MQWLVNNTLGGVLYAVGTVFNVIQPEAILQGPAKAVSCSLESTVELYVCIYVRMYKGGPKTGPSTATFNDLLCFPF
jgi:hypothetical protein